MASMNLLEVEPDKLLQVHTVSQLQEILMDVSNEIERKRVELRTLVGERYRELIEAADEIEEMRALSQKVIQDVETLNSNMAVLSSSPHTTFFTHPREEGVEERRVALLKLVVDLPQMVWSCVDDSNLVRAAQLYLLARHIRTGFSVDKWLKANNFGSVVLEQQWALLSKLPTSIVTSAESHLLHTHIQPTECVTLLGAVGLLESCCLVDRFLALRLDCLHKLLQLDSNVKSRILDSYAAILSTRRVFSYCFSGEVRRWLEESEKEAVMMTSGLITPYYTSRLPPIITAFRAKWSGSAEGKEEKWDEWLEEAGRLVRAQGTLLLNKVSSLRGLEAMLPGDGPDEAGLWERMYSPLVTERAQELLTASWDQALARVCEHVALLASQQHIESELDLRWLVWREQTSDMVLDQTRTGLWLKGRGLTGRVAGCCAILEEEVAGVTLGGWMSSLSGHQAHHASHCLHRLTAYLRELRPSSPALHALVARFLHAVPLLCPSLQKALSHSTDPKGWEEVKRMLCGESVEAWRRWEDAMLPLLLADLEHIFTTPVTFSHLLASLPVWEVKEEGGGGVRVPAAPSLLLHNSLLCLSARLARAHLPRAVWESAVRRCLPRLLDLAAPPELLCQTHALQALFDLKFLSHHFLNPNFKEVHGLCLSKIQEVEAKMDPFDLDVCAPHIHSNVKNCVQHSQSLLGKGVGGKGDLMVSSSEDPTIVVISKSCNLLWFPPLPVTNPLYRHPTINKAKPSKNSKLKAVSVDTKSSNMAASSFFTEWFS